MVRPQGDLSDGLYRFQSPGCPEISLPQCTCGPMMPSTSFKCPAMCVPLHRCISSITRARHRAGAAGESSLSLMRLFLSCARKIAFQSPKETRTRVVGRSLRAKSQATEIVARSFGIVVLFSRIRPARLSYLRRSGHRKSRYGSLVHHREGGLSASTNSKPLPRRSMSNSYSTSKRRRPRRGVLMARALRASS